MRRLLTVLTAAVICSPSLAGTRPLLDWLGQISPVPLPNLSSAVDDALSIPVAKGGALQYALHVPLAQASDRDGEWFQRDGHAVWRWSTTSTGALSMSASLEQLRLPAGSVLRIADDEGVVWSETRTISQREDFQTSIVPGETLNLEIELATASRGAAYAVISGVQHGYRQIDSVRKSGSCNVDTSCGAADPWSDAVRASARITVAGTSLCSAVLLNNTAQNGDPLMLTADHCGLTFDNANRTVVYWNYETTPCSGSPNGSLRQNQSGAELLARNANPDFALLRLDDLPAESFNVYYAGWDSTGGTFSRGVSVHHPRGHEKRISFFERTPRKVRALVDGDPVQSWEVFWNDGVTEPGSSGSGLFDQNQRVVGQLSGGNSSCENPDGSDVYGRVDFAWSAEGGDQASLAPWLDPNRTGERSIDGLDGSDPAVSARRDEYTVGQRVSTIPLDVLQNDFGLRPLQILSATASSGNVQIIDQLLVLQPDEASPATLIEYEIMDRHGNVSQAQAEVVYSDAADARGLDFDQRGGALPGGLLLLLFVGLSRRQQLKK